MAIELALALALSAAPVQAKAAATPAAPRVFFLAGDNTSVTVARAIREFGAAHPEAAAIMAPAFVSERDVALLRERDLTQVRVLFVDSHSRNSVEQLEKEVKHELIRRTAERGKAFVLGEAVVAKSALTSAGGVYSDRLRDYWRAEGWQNIEAMLCLAASTEFGQSLAVPPPRRRPTEGYYHPDAAKLDPFATFAAFRDWYAASGHSKPGQPFVAVPFYGSLVAQEQTGVLDAVIRELEARGLNALPMYGHPASKVWEKLLLDENGAPRAQAALAFNFRFDGPEAQEVVARAGIPILNLIRTFARSEQEWRSSKTGLSVFESVFQTAVPELNGLIAPIVVGTEERVFDPGSNATVVVSRAIPERVAMAVKRVQRYLALQRKANSEKRLALVYYNYPPGKANIGASYLNTLRSVSVMLQRLRAEGYDVGDGPLTEEEVTRRALSGGRNVGSYAPGELAEMVKSGQVVRVPAARYQRWFDALPEEYRTMVARDWGEPDETEGMWIRAGSGLDMVVPAATYGKVAVLPQPDRGFGQDLKKLYHSMDVTPPHHYLGVYRWLRDDFGADAIVHVGTHGTLEWLSGKSVGLTESDAPDLMIDELPDVYVYNVDVVGEGLVAKRRGGAHLIDHMVPPLKKGGLYGEYAALYEIINDLGVAQTKDEGLAAAHSEKVRAKLDALGLGKDLSLKSSSGPLTLEETRQVEDYLLDLKSRNLPYGLHTFGVVPEPALREGTVAAILEPDKSLGPLARAARGKELESRIERSGPRELESWLRALAGRSVPVGTGNDPVRNPDSLPTGNNFYGVDPTKVPKKVAWELGVRLADEMIADHLKRTGGYPTKVAFVIWGSETLRNEGVSESQFFHLLGTRPVWDARGKVVDVEVIPRAKLGRPRIDVVISSAAEALFGHLTELMDKAVQKVNLLEEPDNIVRSNTLANSKRLERRGYSGKDALRRAGVRIFDEPPGQYNLNVARIVQNSGSWDKASAVANDYFQKMGHGFGNGFWGENMEDAFRLTLSGTEKVVHGRSSTLYGTLDNDDFFMYAGGLVQAVRELDGHSPELMVNDLQQRGKESVRPIAEVMGMEFRSRQTNPLWLEGMMKDGYAGAHEMREHLENLWGWQVTVPEVVGDEKWQQVYETYVLDKNEVGLDAFFERASPSARLDMLARMVESVRKGYWSPAPEVRARLASELVSGANAHGLSCVSFVCQNPALAQFTIEEGVRAALPAEALQKYRARVEAAAGRKLDELSKEMSGFVRQTEASHAARAQVQATRNVGEVIRGKVLEKQSPREADARPKMPVSKAREVTVGAALFVVGAAAWLHARRRASKATGEPRAAARPTS
jgi:cobaltochelatase CobN